MQSTISSGDMSASSFHSGLPSTAAIKSHTALTSAAVARWITPFSGPTQRSWGSFVRRRQKPAMSARISSSVSCSTSGARDRMAETQSSFPRPIVNVSPCPATPSRSVRRMT
jgi:hypothetical protein